MSRTRMVRTLLGEWIEAERMARRQKMEAAAEECGISEMTLANAGMRKARMATKVMAAIGAYLRIAPEMVPVLAGVPAASPGPPYRVYHRTAGRHTVLGQALERERRSRRHSMEQAAEAVGVHVGTLLTVKTGEHRPYRETRERLAAYLGVMEATVEAWHAMPADPPLPFETWLGWKLHPTVRPYAPSRALASCLDCVFIAGCREDVARGDFAWCEDAIQEDLCPGEPESVYESEWEASYV